MTDLKSRLKYKTKTFNVKNQKFLKTLQIKYQYLIQIYQTLKLKF